jgi:hypothetical protein
MAAFPLVLLTGCGRPAAPVAGADAAAASPPAAPVAVAPDSVEQLRFNSIIAGFELAVPTSWGRRYTVSERSEPSEYPKALHVVEFMYPPDEGGVPPNLLAIVVYRAADWSAVRGSGAGEEVAQQDGRVFVALPAARDTPFAKDSPDGQRFEAARVSVDEIRGAITVR